MTETPAPTAGAVCFGAHLPQRAVQGTNAPQHDITLLSNDFAITIVAEWIMENVGTLVFPQMGQPGPDCKDRGLRPVGDAKL